MLNSIRDYPDKIRTSKSISRMVPASVPNDPPCLKQFSYLSNIFTNNFINKSIKYNFTKIFVSGIVIKIFDFSIIK